MPILTVTVVRIIFFMAPLNITYRCLEKKKKERKEEEKRKKKSTISSQSSGKQLLSFSIRIKAGIPRKRKGKFLTE